MTSLPILSILIFLPLIGVLFLLTVKGDQTYENKICGIVAILTSIITLFISIFIWKKFNYSISNFQFVELAFPLQQLI